MAQTALQVPCVFDGEVRIASVSFIGLLDDGESLSGTPTAVELTTSDLTISNESINSKALTINNKSVAKNKAVQFKFLGQKAGTTYTIEVTCGTDSSPVQTLKIKVKFTTED